MDFSQIKQLREMTGAGMSDCQLALNESSGDMDKAVDILRKKGQKMADKKSSRTAKEGVIAISKKENKVAMVIINCETDFVARNKDFIKAAQEFSDKLLEMNKTLEFESWANDKIKNELIVKIGENLQLNSFDIVEGTVLGSYLHSNKKIASVVVLSSGTEELAKDIAMHITAMDPQYLCPEDIPDDVITKEKEIYKEQLKSEGKPENIIENILNGKLEKFYKDSCLTKQAFIKDDKISIEQLLKNSGENIAIEKFTRYSL
jgi:elongation factor Ts